jgi:FHS family glucose/mannose:H+ symporter-like MFS transporter
MFSKHRVFFAACLGMLLFGIVFLSLGSMVNMLAKRFHLDDSHIGTLTALLPGGILAGSLIFGPIVDRFGYKWLLILCSLMVLVALEGIAFTQKMFWVHASILLIGFGGGMLNGATNALVADVSAGERGAKLSLLGVFFGIGALGMPSLLGLLSRHLSPEIIIACIGAFIVLPIAYFLVTSFPPPKQTQNASLNESLTLLKEPMLLLMGLILAFQSGMEGMANDWTTRYFTKVLMATDQESLYALTSLVAAMTVTRLLLGGLLKKVPAHFVLFASAGFVAAGALLMMLRVDYPSAVVAVILIGIGLSACFPVLLGYIGDLYPRQSGTAFSIAFVIALSGNMVINKFMGYIGQTYGTHHFTRVLLTSICCSAVLLFVTIQKLNLTKPNLLKNK